MASLGAEAVLLHLHRLLLALLLECALLLPLEGSFFGEDKHRRFEGEVINQLVVREGPGW